VKNRSNFKHQQSGTALITVVLIAAVVIVMVVESVKTIQYQKQLSSNLINKDQAYSYLMGMEELAKIYLKKAFENEKEDTVHLGQLWAQEDITFPLDGGGMTANIRDMQSCLNLNSLLTSGSGGNNTGDTKNPPNNGGIVNNSPSKSPGGNNLGGSESGGSEGVSGVKIFEELVNRVKPDTSIIGKDLAASLKDWMDSDIEPTGAEGAEDDFYQALEIPYRTANSAIAHESELLTIRGFNRDIYFALKPHICVINDDVSDINVNTISEESSALVYAILNSNNKSGGSQSITESDVKKAISARPEEGYESVGEFVKEMGLSGNANFKTTNLTVTSHFFEMKAKAEIGKTRVEMKTLFKREDDNDFSVQARYFGRE